MHQRSRFQPSQTARSLAAGGFLLAVLGASGCATPLQSEQLLPAARVQYPQPVELTAVPFHPQEEFQCGPAALATVLNYAGVEVTPQALTPQVYLPSREGSLQPELIAATRRHGQLPYLLSPKVEALLAEVNAGNPVLVLQNLGVSWYPRWHYAVVVGFNTATTEVVLRSGTERRHLMPLALFERTWRRGNYWALVVAPPGRLPHTAEELPYVQTIVALEQVGRRKEAAIAYATALTRWPESLPAWMGLGNVRYALGDRIGAVEAFRRATQFHPTSADAHNNLAHVLGELGRFREAESAVQRAIELGGPRLSTYRQTAEEIRRRSGRSLSQ